MKQNIHLTIILLFVVITLNAQYPRASFWTTDMANFAAIDAAGGLQKEVVLFAGSSTFRMWNTLQSDFPESKILNRSFGGSIMTDLIYFFGQVVAPYSPRQVVLYEGDNDLHETAKTTEQFMDDVITMIRMINIYYPNAKILLVSIKPSPSRTATFPKYIEANRLMKAYADKYAHIDYADTWTPMLKQDGTPEAAYFGSDMLHMNASGYVLWKTILEPFLLKSNGSTEENPDAKGDVLIDFGPSSATTPGNWNNIADHQAANVMLIDDRGLETSIRLQVTDPFYNGFNNSGTSSPTGSAAIFPGTATIDNFFGHVNAWGTTPANPAGVIRLSGLDPAGYYSFTIFSSRVGASDIRETKYTFEGAGESVYTLLNSSGNTSEVAITKDVIPTSEGVIAITVTAGPNNNQAEKFYYLGAMRIEYSESPSAVNTPAVPSAKAYYTNGALRINDYTGQVKIDDLTGKRVGEGQMQSGYFPVSLTRGIYVVGVESENLKLMVN